MEKLPSTNYNSITETKTEETPAFELSMDEKEIEELLTINDLYFKEEDYEKLEEEKNIIDYFYKKEFSCIEYIKRKYIIKEKRLIVKNFIMDLILEKFKIHKLSETIITKLKKINNQLISKNDITIDIYYAELKTKFNVDNFPKFLIKETLIRIKSIVSIRLYEQNLDNQLNDGKVKTLTYFYQWLNYTRTFGYPYNTKDNISIPDSTTPFDLLFDGNVCHNESLKLILFHIFILSNASVIKNNEYTRDIFKINYDTILSWFSIKNDEKSFNYENLIENFISLDNIQQLLKNYIEFLFEKYIDTIESLSFIIASFFYCITREIEDINPTFTNDKFKFNYLLDNVINNIHKYSKTKIDNFKFNIKEMISYLDYFQIKEDLNYKKINKIYKFHDIEAIFTQEKLEYNLNARFKEVIKKLKSNYSLNYNLFPIIKNLLFKYFFKFQNFNSDKIIKERIQLIPYSKKYYSNKIIILISGFGAEKDNHPELWKELIKSNRRGMYYFYQWPGDSIGKIFIKAIGNFIPFLNNFINQSIPFIFLSAKQRAKYCGKILALILASRKFFGNCQVDLIGFSLGCHVIKSCLRELYSIENLNHNIINTIMFIAGATHIKNNEKWEKIFNKIVTGRIINCHSDSDYVLKCLFKPCVSKEPIGRNKLIFGNNNMRIENVDMSDLYMKHTDYRKHFKELIDKVDL